MLFCRDLSIVSSMSNHVGAMIKDTQTTGLHCAKQGGKIFTLFQQPSDILLCKQLGDGALTSENRHKLLGGKLNWQLARLRQNGQWKSPNKAHSKTEHEILSLRDFLPRV